MRGPYSDYAAPPVYVYPVAQPRGVQFSSTELRQLAIAILGLGAAFTIVLVSPVFGFGLYLFNDMTLNVVFDFLISLASVASGVGLHEIMHKIVAERYGHWAEFRYSLRGILMSFMFAFLGVIIGAPGATYIAGPVTPAQNSRISAAGPLTNIVLGVVFLGATIAVYPESTVDLVPFLLYWLFSTVASVNLILGAFNMIPIMPLDGAKVWHWNKAEWLVILILALGVLAAGALVPQHYLFL